MAVVKVTTDRILQSTRANLEYLEYCRVHVEGERVVYAVADGANTRQWNIPTMNTSAVLLGPGSSITQAAIQKLTSERVLVGFTGTGGTPIYMGSFSEYAPTEYLVKWVKNWNSPIWRLNMSKQLAHSRCDNMDRIWPTYDFSPSSIAHTSVFRWKIDQAESVEQLRGFEGEFAKAAYVEMARATSLTWRGRDPQSAEQDLANAFLDHGNYLGYGLAAVVLWTLAIPPGLAVNHGSTRAGGLVFDLADIIKDSVVLPIAFQSASAGIGRQQFREAVIDKFDEVDSLSILFTKFKNSINQVRPQS